MGNTKRVPADVAEAFRREFARYVREAFDNNQSRAGEALGVSQGHVSSLLSGRNDPGLHVLLTLNRLTGRSIESWLGIDEPASEVEGRLEAAVVRGIEMALRSAASSPRPPLELPPAPPPTPRHRKA